MTNDDVQWICAPCGARYCNGMRDEHIATWHVGRCDICANETAVTEPRDFGYLKATSHTPTTGALYKKANAHIAELKNELAERTAAMIAEKEKLEKSWYQFSNSCLININNEKERRETAEAALAIEHERRKAAEEILSNIRYRGISNWDTLAIEAHFTRYEK